MLYEDQFHSRLSFSMRRCIAYCLLLSSILVVLLPNLLGCEGKGISLIGKDGEICPRCSDTCEGIFVDLTGRCSCESCAKIGYDPDASVLLWCADRGVWEFHLECPGGASVSCLHRQAYEIQCLDENGNEIPR